MCATYDLMAQFIAKYFVVRNSAYHYPHNPAQRKSVNTEMLRQQVRAHFSWLYAPVREECSLPGSIFRWRAQLLTHAYSGCGRKYRWGYMAYGWVGMRWEKKTIAIKWQKSALSIEGRILQSFRYIAKLSTFTSP